MRRLLPLALLVAAVAAAPSVSAEQPVLDTPRHGADAVRALGQQISEVARAHHTTGAELRELLQEDLSLWVDVQGRLFYVDPPAPAGVEAAESAETTALAPQSAADALKLHSKPGASRTIMLDFDGAGVDYNNPIGGAWSAGYMNGDGNAEPYDRDGNLAGFGTGEVQEIYSIWQRVAEDFAPFDVDVTTQEPGFESIDRSSGADEVYGTRVVLTSSATTCGCGGVAYVGVFDHTTSHAYYQPAFVYNEGAKAAAEAASHEAGHNLGLSHDGTRSVGYYAGHGSWAPIMGVGYDRPVSQWSRGEYSGAKNPEDDFAIAVSHGATLRADDHGVWSKGTALAAGASAGVVETRTDVDDFGFSVSGAATLSIAVAPAGVSPNLDLRATLRRVDGSLVGQPVDPGVVFLSKDLAGGLDATWTQSVDAGTYVLSVEGVGYGDPLSTGYSDYGSVGAYNIRVTGATLGEPVYTTAVTPGAPSNLAAQGTTTAINLTWGAGQDAISYGLQRATVGKGGTLSTWSTVATPTTTSHSDNPGSGTFAYRVRSVNGAGTSAWSNEVTGALAKTSNKPQRTR